MINSRAFNALRQQIEMNDSINKEKYELHMEIR